MRKLETEQPKENKDINRKISHVTVTLFYVEQNSILCTQYRPYIA